MLQSLYNFTLFKIDFNQLQHEFVFFLTLGKFKLCVAKITDQVINLGLLEVFSDNFQNFKINA